MHVVATAFGPFEAVQCGLGVHPSEISGNVGPCAAACLCAPLEGFLSCGLGQARLSCNTRKLETWKGLRSIGGSCAALERSLASFLLSGVCSGLA